MPIQAGPISYKAYSFASNIETAIRTVPPLGAVVARLSPVERSAGPVTDNIPHPPAAYSTNGVIADSSFGDWYYRIHILPVRLDLGNLVGNQQQTVRVWNAFFVDQYMTDFALANGEGITVTQPVGLPYNIKPLQTLDYLFEISANGPPVINATATWSIEGVDYNMPITGRRIVVFPFMPNWSSPVEETLEHLTVLETSYTGKEQISEIREEPRRIMQYNFRIFTSDVNIFDNMMFGWSARLFCVPLWQEKTKLTSAVSAGATSLPMVTTARTFEVGSLAIIFKDVNEYEVVEVATVASGSIGVVRPTENAWPVGTRVYPGMVAAADPELATSRGSDTHVDAMIRFTVSPADNFPRMAQVAAPLTYRGYELYTKTTNWIAPLGVSIGARQSLTDNGEGIFRLTKKAFPLIQRGFRWLLRSREDAELVRQFFARRRGRLKPVWIQSGTRDFVLKSNVTSASTIIEVENNGYGEYVNLHAARRDILIQMRNGTFYARRITAWNINGAGNGEITMDAALGQNITPAQVKKISYLGFYRLQSDSYTFVWHTNTVAAVETNFVLKESP